MSDHAASEYITQNSISELNSVGLSWKAARHIVGKPLYFLTNRN